MTFRLTYFRLTSFKVSDNRRLKLLPVDLDLLPIDLWPTSGWPWWAIIGECTLSARALKLTYIRVTSIGNSNTLDKYSKQLTESVPELSFIHLLDSSGDWSFHDQQLHINVLEMKAVILALQHFILQLQGKVVLIVSDNTTVVSYLNKQGGTHVWALYALV